jgi:ABC-type antimicrobial peptide transport system permease subunit
MRTLWQDIRCGIRMLQRNPGFTGIAVIVLALGIGVNTGVFSAIEWLCLRPSPSLFLTHGVIGVLRASVSGAASDPLSGIRLNLSTAGFCLGITFLATLVFGLLPALYASRADLLNALKTDVARVSHAGRTLRGLN